jgi:hypothetical protein
VAGRDWATYHHFWQSIFVSKDISNQDVAAQTDLKSPDNLSWFTDTALNAQVPSMDSHTGNPTSCGWSSQSPLGRTAARPADLLVRALVGFTKALRTTMAAPSAGASVT